MGRTPFYRTSKELVHHFLNEFKHVLLLMVELEHLNFGFERSDIEPTRPSLDLLDRLFIELTQTLLFRTLNRLERVYLTRTPYFWL